MQYVKLSARDLRVSRLLFGTLTMGPLQRNLPIDEGAELLCEAARQGVNFIDTAEYYYTYPFIRVALRSYPELVICTKSYAYDREGAKRSVALAQEGIGRDCIDVFLLHEQESEHTLRGHADALEYYQQLRDQGIIRAIGISTHHVAAVRAAAAWPGIDVVFTICNRTGIGIADGTCKQMENAMHLAHQNDRAVMAMKVLGGGHLIGEREQALSYVLSNSDVDVIAIGMQSKAEIAYNVAMMEGIPPDDWSAKQSATANRRLHIQEECIGCGQCVRRCGQHALSIQHEVATVDQAKCVRCGYCAAVCPLFCIKVI